MNPNIVIINHTEHGLDIFKNKKFNTLCCDVKSTNLKLPNYFVSPSNSLLFFDGGIDAEYLKMFKDNFTEYNGNIRSMQFYIQSKLKANNIISTTFLGRKFLPIGGAMLVEIPNSNNEKKIICAPTMLMPQNVRSTKNAYHAMSAALKVWPGDGTLIVPLLACGIGNMDVEEASKQIEQAIIEHTTYVGDLYLPNNMDQIMSEQPKVYANTEFMNINPTDINHV